jgi:hypothetical protein
MAKIIKIDTCAPCPYKLTTPDFKRKCRVFGYKIIDVPITTIPDWCPLEDAVLTSAIHSDGEGRCACGELLGKKCPKCQRILDSVTRRR